MPFLLPPPDFRPAELAQLGLTGTCEMQICRSIGPWSMGTTGRVEHSIQNAYLKGWSLGLLNVRDKLSFKLAIQMSEHFVYIENQFFITSCVPLLSDGTFSPLLIPLCKQNHCKRRQDRKPYRRCNCPSHFPGTSRRHQLEVLCHDTIASWIHVSRRSQ